MTIDRSALPGLGLTLPLPLRDQGLVRAIGTRRLTANIINVVVGAGIFATPGALAACLGVYAPLAFLFGGVAIGAVAICFAEGGSRIPTSGGAYGYIEEAFGPMTGYVAGMLLLLSDALACGGIAAALADIVVTLVKRQWQAPLHAGIIVAVIGGVALVNLGGVVRGARLVDLATGVKLIPLVVFLVAGVGAIRLANFVPTAAPNPGGAGRGLILVIFLLTGMEISMNASGEVEQPSRTIPRALGISLTFLTLLYIAIQATAQGILGASLAQSTVPLADAMGRVHPALRALLLAGAAVSMLGWVSSDILATPRILFAFARDGMLPARLGRVHPVTHAPQAAIVCYATLALLLSLTGSFAELAVLATLTCAAVYIAGSLAAWKLARMGVAQAGPPLNFRWLGSAAVIASLSMLVLIGLASRAEILGLLMVIGVSATVYLLQTRYRLAKAKG